jgi:hypothetical protein
VKTAHLLTLGRGLPQSAAWSGLVVGCEPKALHMHLLGCLPNLHAAFWPGKPADSECRPLNWINYLINDCSLKPGVLVELRIYDLLEFHPFTNIW